MNLDSFKHECMQSRPDTVVQKHIVDGTTFFFDQIRKGEEFDFKKDIAEIIDVHIRDIVIVGSGKLGFSLKPNNSENGLYLYKEFDSNYKEDNELEKSDLDVAIVSSVLFDKEIKNLV
jgi:hypothetical protein